MNEIKKEYSKVRLQLMNPNKTPLTILTDKTQLSAYNITLNKKINEVDTLTFDIPFDSPKIDESSCENLVKVGFEHYIIKEISMSDSDNRTRSVSCVHEADEIKGIINTPISVIGVTAQSMFNTIKTSTSINLTNYIWKGTDILDTTKRSLISEDERSVFENLIEMAELFQGWLEFKTNKYGEIEVYLRKNPIERGKFVKKGRDLKQLNITYDTNEIFTRLIPLGEKDNVGIELNIMGVNPTGKSYVENYDYYLAKGMTLEQIENTPKCQQEKIMRENDITDANELLRIAQEELEKCSVPKLNGSVDMVDVSVFEDSVFQPPIIGEKIIVVDKDINFNISAIVTGISRNYDNPLLTKIDVSNVIKYDNIFKDLVHSSEKLDKITGKDKNGQPYVVASHVQGEIDAVKSSFHGMLDSIDAPENKTAILYECRINGDSRYGAMALGSSGFLISDELGADGQWIWKTFGTGKGFYADLIVAGVIKADLIKTGILKSFNSKSWINMDDGTFNFADKIKFINNLFEINSGNVIINATGEIINNGALTIKNKANKTVFSGDINGDIEMSGILRTYDNSNKAVEINKRNMLFYDWEGVTRTMPVGRIYATRTGSDPNKPGLAIANEDNALLSLAYYKDGTFYPYIDFDERNLLGNGSAITFMRNYAMKGFKAVFGTNNLTQIYDNANRLVFRFPNGTDNGFMFLNQSGDAKFSYIEGANYPLSAWQNFYCAKDFTVTGSKNSLQKTKTFGDRLINAYETAEYYFGDIGSGKINNGECVIHIDEILQECINTKLNYHVFTQVYNGNITKIKRFENYFIILGEEGTEFSWELKAKRIGYEYSRLENPSNNYSDIVNLDEVIDESIKEINTENTKIENELNYDLADLLLGQ